MFDYTNKGENWYKKYSSTCGYGKRQSPIDLQSDYKNFKPNTDMRIKGVGYEDFQESDVKWE